MSLSSVSEPSVSEPSVSEPVDVPDDSEFVDIPYYSEVQSQQSIIEKNTTVQNIINKKYLYISEENEQCKSIIEYQKIINFLHTNECNKNSESGHLTIPNIRNHTSPNTTSFSNTSSPLLNDPAVI